ncbi:MAG: DUF4288 domain-containing protein [Ktedonobacteraceae bacterium]|nr:DUF4288 domain-containing protein [Ktedonobacteraceae bacterium]
MKAQPVQSNLPFYIAVLLWESSSDRPDYRPLYEESILLIAATSEEEARQKALVSASKYSYDNVYGETITWSLKHLVDVQPALEEKFSDVTELYARHFRNYEAYRAFEPLLSDEKI